MTPYDTGRDPLNDALDRLSEWFTMDPTDDDGFEIDDGTAYELLMRVAQDVVEAADRPTEKD